MYQQEMIPYTFCAISACRAEKHEYDRKREDNIMAFLKNHAMRLYKKKFLKQRIN